ncbi:arabinan endo-1,5-alpha-L-arabinosidase [Saccharopolyspora lacisalsi]|uniref:Arabinan endo-1,5-alpha-L-arabinosidase n=1 Tax=Halosaccharopolyspora lacisalsi TaxID=1000566 RepID=A0A839DS19_9PSEU|nr:arabinan endo-1,5-alpha-L-arabinosidase [Halosaccharopolyspora lacisalsi]MBA8823750.1 arabinan endo-1,5-alpha-L-arabinosidase [Halosaccharopolyspora lacisalsi]
MIRLPRGLLHTAVALSTVCVTLGVAQPAVAADYPNPGQVTGDVAAHDPSMVRTSEGYALYSTHDRIEARTSPDRTGFTRAGSALGTIPSWVYEYNSSGDVWAPDVSQHNGRYWMYYSASSYGSNHSAIGLATSATGRPGSWTDRGIVHSSDSGDDHNAIDPALLVDRQGRWWLSFGSFWSGIRMIRLDPATGKRSPQDSTLHHLASRPNDASHAVEAPYIVEHGGYYYLFVSFGRCCQGTDSTYRVVVGRSSSPTGPYVDRSGTPMLSGGGTEILATHDDVIGPGGQSVLGDTDGDLLVYHYYDANAGGAPRLGLNLLGWDEQGWPYVY